MAHYLTVIISFKEREELILMRIMLRLQVRLRLKEWR